MTVTTHSVEETRDLGASFARTARPGDIFALRGELGTGKTEFARGFVLALDPRAQVCSPSFSIVNTYQTDRFPVHHFDFYRLGSPGELAEVGFDEYLGGDAVCLVEWADLIPDVIPPGASWIAFTDNGGTARTIRVLPSRTERDGEP